MNSMNLGFKGIIKQITSQSSLFSFVPVRYRYYADKIARGPIAKKFGYKDKVYREGLLPRLKNAKRLPAPLYKPSNDWTDEKRTFGQNDYIDILGGGKLMPADVCYNIPKWLRGKKGNEMQLLLVKKKHLSCTRFEHDFPKAWDNINKRIRYLYKYLNRKTKTSFMNR